MLGYCGRDCEHCESFNAKTGDGNRCTGCRSEGPAADLRNSECPIRLCARDNRQAICAGCSSFPCEKLNGILEEDPDAKEHLYNILGCQYT